MKISSFISNLNNTGLNFSTSQTDSAIQSSFIKKNPFCGKDLHQVSSASMMDAVRSVQLAQKAFEEWRQSTIEERLLLMSRFQKALIDHQDQFAQYEALDQGLPLDFVKKFGLQSVLKTLENVIQQLKKQVESQHEQNIQYSPVGVITIIASWNLSLRTVLERVFPALAAGNTVVVKVSSMSPVTAISLSQLIEATQAYGLIQVIVSHDHEISQILISHPSVKGISFTGRLETSQKILQRATDQIRQQFKKWQIGTGSKNSAVVTTELDSHLLQSVMSSFLIGQGQLVWNSSRLFILEKYEKQWQQALQDFLLQLKPSQGIEDQSLWTPCLKEGSYQAFSEISQLAVQDHAHLQQTKFSLSDEQKKNFLPVTFTQDMSKCSTLQQDQIDAPLFILTAVKYPFDIPKYSNVSYYGFAAHLWGDPEKLNKVSESLEVGLVCSNKWSVEIPGPVSAVKQSGYGLQDYQVFGDFYSNVKILT